MKALWRETSSICAVPAHYASRRDGVTFQKPDRFEHSATRRSPNAQRRESDVVGRASPEPLTELAEVSRFFRAGVLRLNVGTKAIRKAFAPGALLGGHHA